MADRRTVSNSQWHQKLLRLRKNRSFAGKPRAEYGVWGVIRSQVSPQLFLRGPLAQVFWEADNAWYRGTVTGYHKSTNKHSVLYDDDDMERVCLDDVPHRCAQRRMQYASM